MPISFETSCRSYTGSLLYSDTYGVYAGNRGIEAEMFISPPWDSPQTEPTRVDKVFIDCSKSKSERDLQHSLNLENKPEVRYNFTKKSFLNKCAAIPIVGILAGITRVVLAIIHIIGHLLASLIYWKKDHLYHVAKGGAELLRGVIEMIPVIGRVFVWAHDARKHRIWHPISDLLGFKYNNSYLNTEYSVFLVRIKNLTAPDEIDECISFDKSNPPSPKMPRKERKAMKIINLYGFSWRQCVLDLR